MHSCFACGDPVLGLKGEYGFLATYHMHDDDPILVSGATGPCHLVCLHQSGWGFDWARHFVRILEYSPQMARLYEDSTCVGIVHKELKEVHVVRSDGVHWEIRRRIAKKLRKTKNGWLMPFRQEFNLILQNRESLASKVQNRLIQTGEFPLLELLDGLGLADKVNCREALEDGRLIFDQELKEHWTPIGVSARIQYCQLIPDQIHQIWEQCAAKLGILPKR